MNTWVIPIYFEFWNPCQKKSVFYHFYHTYHASRFTFFWCSEKLKMIWLLRKFASKLPPFLSYPSTHYDLGYSFRSIIVIEPCLGWIISILLIIKVYLGILYPPGQVNNMIWLWFYVYYVDILRSRCQLPAYNSHQS